MSLNIPNAPNAGLFKQGYNKYVPNHPAIVLDPEDLSIDVGRVVATIRKMARFCGI
jgi:hypothetical protein